GRGVQRRGEHEVGAGDQGGELLGGAAVPPRVAIQPGVQFQRSALHSGEPLLQYAVHLVVPAPVAVFRLSRGEDDADHWGGVLRTGHRQIALREPQAVPGEHFVESGHSRVVWSDHGHADGYSPAIGETAVQIFHLPAADRPAHEDDIGVVIRHHVGEVQSLRSKNRAPGDVVRNPVLLQRSLHALHAQHIACGRFAVQEARPSGDQYAHACSSADTGPGIPERKLNIPRSIPQCERLDPQRRFRSRKRPLVVTKGLRGASQGSRVVDALLLAAARTPVREEAAPCEYWGSTRYFTIRQLHWSSTGPSWQLPKRNASHVESTASNRFPSRLGNSRRTRPGGVWKVPVLTLPSSMRSPVPTTR